MFGYCARSLREIWQRGARLRRARRPARPTGPSLSAGSSARAGCTLRIRYRQAARLPRPDRRARSPSDNPFSAGRPGPPLHQVDQEGSGPPPHFKLQLARLLFRRDYGKEEVRELFKVVDCMMRLPAGTGDNLQAGGGRPRKEKGMAANFMTLEQLLPHRSPAGRAPGRPAGRAPGRAPGRRRHFPLAADPPFRRATSRLGGRTAGGRQRRNCRSLVAAAARGPLA